MNAKKITLVSHYNKHQLVLRLPSKVHDELKELHSMGSINDYYAMDAINDDIERYRQGKESAYVPKARYITKAQADKISRFFGKDNKDYFDEVIFED